MAQRTATCKRTRVYRPSEIELEYKLFNQVTNGTNTEQLVATSSKVELGTYRPQSTAYRRYILCTDLRTVAFIGADKEEKGRKLDFSQIT